MYSPAYARVTDRTMIDPVIHENPFATLCFSDPTDHSPQCFHLPLILKDERLFGHLALANEARKKIDGAELLVIFHGPNCYISPDWYGTENNVPTWNYVSIHLRGIGRIRREDDFLRSVLQDLAQHEDPSLLIGKNIDSHPILLKSIVGIEVEIRDVEAKFKLAQSKPKAERENLISALRESGVPERQRVADAMLRTLPES